jgi:hypothetical protein
MGLDIFAENCGGKKYVRATLKRRTGETLHDCRRIAALYSHAPEMLEALQTIIKAYKAYDGGLSKEADLFDAITAAKDISNKAKGENANAS